VDPFEMPATKGKVPEGLEGYSHEEILEMCEMVKKGQIPE
jgi:hypothetical protein